MVSFLAHNQKNVVQFGGSATKSTFTDWGVCKPPTKGNCIRSLDIASLTAGVQGLSAVVHSRNLLREKATLDGSNQNFIGDVMIYVLIIVAIVNGGVNVSMQEFSDVERCKTAAASVMKATEELRNKPYATQNMIAICMQK